MITGVITPLTPSTENPSKRKAPAGWRRGYAADCKSVKTGSIPVPASTLSLPLLHFSNHPPKSAAGLFRVSRFGHGVFPAVA